VRLAGGVQLDIVGVDIPKRQSFVRSGLLLDLEPLMKLDSTFERHMFYPWVWDGYRVGNGLYGIPDVINHRQVFVRGQVLNEAGIAMPGNDWTWDEFVSIARKVTRDTSGDGKNDVFGMEGYRLWWDFWPVFAWGGGLYKVNAAGQVELAITSPETIEAFETFAALESQAGIVTSPAVERAYGGRVNMIKTGQIAMYIGDVYGLLQEESEFSATLEPTLRLFPKVKTQPVVGFTNGWAITSQTPNKELAWKFLNHLTSRAVMMEGRVKYGSIGARMDVNSQANLFPGLDRSLVQQIMFGLSRMDIDLHAHQGQGPWDNVTAVTNATDRMRAQEAPVRTILESIEPVLKSNLQEYLQEMAARYQLGPGR